MLRDATPADFAAILALDEAFVVVPLIACEFDIEPPNPASERLHARLGFREVGRQLLDGVRQMVSLQALDVAAGNTLPGRIDGG